MKEWGLAPSQPRKNSNYRRPARCLSPFFHILGGCSRRLTHATMLLAYNTNGLAHHDPAEAIALIGRFGLSRRGADARSWLAQSPACAARVVGVESRHSRLAGSMRHAVRRGNRGSVLVGPATEARAHLDVARSGGTSPANRVSLPGHRHGARSGERLRFDLVGHRCARLWTKMLHFSD